MSGLLSLLPIDPASYGNHRLHDSDRDWPETNCYVDVWIEVLHSLGLEPVAGLAFTLAVGFDGDQWEFFKFPDEDLRALYGIEVREINVWRPLHEHVQLHLERGNLLTVEVDSWFLPDTAGVSYRLDHQKTTIVPQMIDHANERLGYFHNTGYFEVAGIDYRGAMRLDRHETSLAPYVELVDLGAVTRRPEAALRTQAAGLVADYLGRRPRINPVAQLAARVAADEPWLRAHPDCFHGYAFGTLRSCGAWASTAASFVEWLGGDSVADAATSLTAISAAAKTAQFKLARVASGRLVDLSGLFEQMANDWQCAIDALVSAYVG